MKLMRARNYLKRIGIALFVLLLIPLSFFLLAFFRERDTREVIAPDTGRFVRAADVDLFIQEAGDPKNPPIFLLHGMAAWSETWRSTIDVLAQNGWYVVAIDMPPFGFSEHPQDLSYWRGSGAERLDALRQSLGLQKVTVLAHSYGSRAGFEFAMRYGESISSIVVVDPALSGIYEEVAPEDESFVSRLLSVRPLRTGLVSMTLTNPLLSRKLIQSFMYKKEAATDAIVALYSRPSTLENTTRDLGYWFLGFMTGKDTGKSALKEEYQKLTMPVGLIWGREDTTTPLAQGVLLKSYLAQADLVVIDGVGHMPHIEDPKTFNESLLRLLKKP